MPVLTVISIGHGIQTRYRVEVVTALRDMRLALDQARLSARRQRRPCGLSLGTSGWQPPSRGALPACLASNRSFYSTDKVSALRIHTNLPEVVRFTANGLLIDGGLVVVSSLRSTERRCLVVSLPLGITRVGRYVDAAAGLDAGTSLRSSSCRPDERR